MKVDEVINSEKNLILIPIETLVCQNCGERYYDRKTIRKLEEIRDKVKRNELEIKEIGKVYRAA